jgi:hypothetical protein
MTAVMRRMGLLPAVRLMRVSSDAERTLRASDGKMQAIYVRITVSDGLRWIFNGRDRYWGEALA